MEGLTNDQKDTAILDAVTDHSEKWLLAVVFYELQTHELLVIDTDAKKFLVFRALGTVECIAEATIHSA